MINVVGVIDRKIWRLIIFDRDLIFSNRMTMKTGHKRYTGALMVMILLTGPAGLANSQEVVFIDRHLVQYDTGLVHDTETGLDWYAGPDKSLEWDEAKKWVQQLDLDGGGWRMPTCHELKTLSSIGDGISNITPLLYNSGYWIWAGRTKDEASKWVFSFSYGGEGWNGQAPLGGGRVIAVRKR